MILLGVALRRTLTRYIALMAIVEGVVHGQALDSIEGSAAGVARSLGVHGVLNEATTLPPVGRLRGTASVGGEGFDPVNWASSRPTNSSDKQLASGAKEEPGDMARSKWCCLRAVHVGKTGGTTIGEYAADHALEHITVHHVYSYFEELHLLHSYCIFGTTIRHPVSLFVSMFWWCRSRKCPREYFRCGFLECDPKSELAKMYGHPKTNVTYQDFVTRPSEWLGQNRQVRFIAQTHGTTHKIIALHNGTKLGEESLLHAKEHLQNMDFVIVNDHYRDQFVAYFGIEPPHANPNPYYAGSSIEPTKAEQDNLINLNALDYRFYEYALGLSERLAKRGLLQQFATLGHMPPANKAQVNAKSARKPRIKGDEPKAKTRKCLMFDHNAAVAAIEPPETSFAR